MEYRDKKFRNLAEVIGIKNLNSTDADLLKHILASEGLVGCFGIASGSCTRIDCLVWQECEKCNRFVRYLC